MNKTDTFILGIMIGILIAEITRIRIRFTRSSHRATDDKVAKSSIVHGDVIARGDVIDPQDAEKPKREAARTQRLRHRAS